MKSPAPSQSATGGRWIDRLEPRRLLSTSAFSQAVDTAILNSAATQYTGALQVSLKVSDTSVRQSQPVTAMVTVTNTASTTLIGVDPSLSQSTGDLLLTKLATPSIAVIPAGKSVIFKYTIEELVVGTAALSADVQSPYATSAGAAVVTMTTIPKTVGKTAVTDASGNAYLKVGVNIVPVHFADHSTGDPISGLTLAIASTNRRNSRAVIVIADSQNRYPLQMAVLEGASTGATPAALLGNNVGTAAAPSPPTVDVTAGAGAALTAAVGAIQTTFLPPVASAASSGIISTAFVAALKTIVASKLPLPLPDTGSGAPKILYSSKTIEVPELAQQVASTAAEFGLTSQMTEALLETGLHTGEVIQPEIIPLAEAAEVALTGGDLALAIGNSLYEETNVQAVKITLISTGGIPYFIFTPVPPPDAADITWTPKDPIADVTIDPANSTSQTYGGGSYQLISKDVLAEDIVGVLPTSGGLNIPVELGTYDSTISAPGFQPISGSSITVPGTGTTVAPALAVDPIASGTLTSALGQPTGFLAPGTQYYLTPHFYDANGNALTVTGTGPYFVNGNPVIFSASNPVGANVVSVDPNTGQVTMGSGFGAGLVTAWCDGVTTTARLVSTNGNGKYPVQPRGSFAVSPGTLHFTAMEGGANPADQTYDIMPLSSSFQNYNYTTRNGFASETPTNVNDYNIMDVSVDITGLTPGTYSVPLTITDSASKYQQSVIVTLTITPAPPATLSSGTYSGNWTYPVFGFGDDYATLTLHLQQTGSKVTGSWNSVILDGSVDTTDDTNGDSFYMGYIIGNTITLIDHSETTFVGTISGNTIVGTSNYLQAAGSFSLTAQG